MDNLIRFVEGQGLRTLVLDHHNTRHPRWRKGFRPLFDRARELGVRLVSATEFMNLDEEPLKAERESLYGGEAANV
jgi:predicted metallo-beta-lactamase superfamily hydrolase